METCNHRNLRLLPPKGRRLRCRHCHLTIDADELAGGPCPECAEATGRRRYDFEPVAAAGRETAYRCEDCGAMILVRKNKT